MKYDLLSPAAARRALALTVVVLGLAWQGSAHAGLFDDEEARRAILELRQRIEATRQAADVETRVAILERRAVANRPRAAAHGFVDGRGSGPGSGRHGATSAAADDPSGGPGGPWPD